MKTRNELTDELATGTGDAETIWRELLAGASITELENITRESTALREFGSLLA